MLCTTSTYIHPQPRGRLQQNKCEKFRLPAACFYESRLKHLLPTGALELIQPIFAAACRAFYESKSIKFLSLIPLCKRRREYLTDRKLLTLSSSTEARLGSGTRCCAQTAGVTPRAEGSPVITSAPCFLSRLCLFFICFKSIYKYNVCAALLFFFILGSLRLLDESQPYVTG